MSAFSSTQISKPTDEQTFERGCLVLFRCLVNDPNIQFNGKRGYAQDGVDIFGFRDQHPAKPVGVQCKLKTGKARLTEREVQTEIASALKFRPSLREYIIATTSSDDPELQRIARERSVEESRGERTITISVWGWETLEQRIGEHVEARNAFDPTYGPHAREQTELLRDLHDKSAAIATNVVEVQTSFREIKSQLLATNLPSDAPETRSLFEAELDAEIDNYRDAIESGRPRLALTLLEALLKRVAHSASGRILFRIKANIGHCHLFLSDEARAASWLSEAYHHAPEEPKAKANFALSYLLQGKASEARAFGVRELVNDPSNLWLAGYVIQAGARCGVDDPLADIPDSLHTSVPVESARVDFLRMRDVMPGWWRAAADASKRHPDSDFLAQCAAEAVIDEVGHSEGFKSSWRLATDVRRQLEDATVTLRRIWDKQRHSENPSKADGLAACVNLLAAYYALGKTSDGLAVAKDAVQAAPNSEALIERAAIAGLEAGDHPFVETLIPRLPETPDAILIRFQYYAGKGDYKNVVATAEHVELAPAHERTTIRTLGRLASLMLGESADSRRDALAELLEASKDDARANVLISEFAVKLGEPEIGDRAYRAAIALVKTNTHRASRAMVARHAADNEDYRVVTDLLDGFVETSFINPDLTLLIQAFANERPVRQRANEFFRSLPSHVRELPKCATAYGNLQNSRGDLQEAEKWFSKAIEGDPLNLTAWLGLFSVYSRQGRSGATLIANRAKDIDLTKVRGSAYQKVGLTHDLRDAGLYETAAAFAYETIRANPNDAQAALLYFGLFMSPHADKMLPKTSAVAKDTWVAVQRGNDRLELLIEDGPSKPTERIYHPSHQFIAPAIGLAVGDSFEQPMPFGAPEKWTVKEIKHKYLHAFHEMHHFNVRFPDAKGLYAFSMKDGDISPILEQAKKQSERNLMIADFYIDKHFPMAVITGMVGEEPSGFAEYIRSLGHAIVACRGDHSEREFAERLALRPPNGGAVLDFYTAWIASTFKLLAPLKAVFGRLIVPRSVVDEFLKMEHDAAHLLGGKSMRVGYHDGQFIRQVTSEAESQRLVQSMEERRTAVESFCEVLPAEIPDDATDLSKTITASCGTHTLDPAFLAAQGDRILISDDMYFRQNAEKECGVKSSLWLQAALNVAKRRNILTRTHYAEAIVGLAICRHSHLALDADTLSDVLEADDTTGLFRFTAVADFIGTKDAEIGSHVRVVGEFMTRVWSLSMSDVKKQAACGRVIEKLLRYRADWKNVVLALRTRIYGDYSAAAYLEGWLRGHFVET